ncbi:hypothetical protein GIB67_016579 [Kingdonia uniflora]|uniref:Uncharacterized protein n=1 Tax=Kingdonia uniflora TaxID=39325 RepID=A0A7J7MZ31_9MAGN|nr:hypothetical protein GIB67_016579 [Kingdonia uniflora]
MLLNIDQWRELGYVLINAAVLGVEEEPITQESQSESFCFDLTVHHYLSLNSDDEIIAFYMEDVNLIHAG